MYMYCLTYTFYLKKIKIKLTIVNVEFFDLPLNSVSVSNIKYNLNEQKMSSRNVLFFPSAFIR